MKDRDFSTSSPEYGSADFMKNRYVRWIFVLSCFALSISIQRPSVATLTGGVLAFAVAHYLTFRKKILEHAFDRFSRKTVCIALVFTLFAVGFNVPVIFRRLSILFADLPATPAYIAIFLFLFLSTAPVFLCFFYAFLARFSDFAVKIHKTSDKVEHCFFMVVMLVALIAVTVIYNQTNCFHAPLGQDGEIIDYDVVYTSDSGAFYKTNAYGCIGAPDNDIRQPLFGLFALPFAVVATLMSWMLHPFIPDSYAVFIQVIQIVLLFATFILMSRLMRLKGLTKVVFLITLMLTYPVLLFSLMWEQYIISVFWLGVFIYVAAGDGQTDRFAFTAATGSILTSAAAFLFTYSKDKWRFFRNGFDCVLAFLSFFVIFGRSGRLDEAFSVFQFTGVKSSFYEKFLQFVNFVSSCWIVPETVILLDKCHCYWLAPVESLNVTGLILLAWSLLGFVLNHKDKFARICAVWVVFSFFVLCLVGWGTTENGLILYTLYFGWAYVCLGFLAVEKLMQKLPMVKYAVNIAFIAVLAYFNIPGIYDLIQFGVKYYPCQ